MDDDATRHPRRPDPGAREPWPRRGERGPEGRPSGPYRRRPDQPGRPPEPPRGPGPRPPAPPARQPVESPTRPVGNTPPLRGKPLPGVRPAAPGGRAAPLRVEPETRPVSQTPADSAAATAKVVARPPEKAAPARTGTPASPRTLGRALLTTAAATIVPGSGHLLLRRRRTGAVIVGVFVLLVLAMVLLATTASRTTLLSNLLSTRVLVLIGIGALIGGFAWIGVIIRTYLLARPKSLDTGPQALGALATAVLCLLVATPFGYAANLANAQRNFLDTLFAGGNGGTSAAEALGKPRLNVLLLGSDAGPDRTGARTDTMMVASIDTHSGKTILFGLPRNLGSVQFPPGSPMAEKFPNGFHDRSDPLSGNYLLNAVYAWGRDHPADAPPTPTSDPGLNLLHQTISYMLGLHLDYYIEVNMAGFAAIIDALGGLRVDVGPNPIPVGGILPNGRQVEPDRYIPAGPQVLGGADALAYARSRTDTSDYKRMGRQRCLLQNLLAQKSPADMLTNFQAVANATTSSVSTNIPQAVLPALVALAGQETMTLESIAFDPSLADPSQPDGRFSTTRADVDYMREVVQRAISGQPLPSAPPTTSRSARATAPTPTAGPEVGATPTEAPPVRSPVSLAATC
ncbi:MAG: LCP family protein [Pseudonocardia sp.]|nr:LCP family protein [Pseudonocardia sp.]